MSRVRGTNKLRRTLRRIEPGISQGVKDDVRDIAEAVKWDAVSRAPVDEGDLVRSIDYRLGRDGLTAIIGPGAKAADIARRKKPAGGNVFRAATKGVRLSKANKELLFQFFVGYWNEYGTKGNPRKNIPARPAQPFMRPAWDLNRQWGIDRMRRSVNNALERAARGL